VSGMAEVNVAIVLVASSVTVPLGLVHGDAAHATMKVAPPVIGETASLNLAVMSVLYIATPVAALTGVTAITDGGVPLFVTAAVPSTGSRPPPHPAAIALSRSMSDAARVVPPLIPRIAIPFLARSTIANGIRRPYGHSAVYRVGSARVNCPNAGAGDSMRLRTYGPKDFGI
jgi:hypothetical protein